MEKKNSSRPFLAHPAGGQETTFYLRVASGHSLSLLLGGRASQPKVLAMATDCSATYQQG